MRSPAGKYTQALSKKSNSRSPGPGLSQAELALRFPRKITLAIESAFALPRIPDRSALLLRHTQVEAPQPLAANHPEGPGGEWKTWAAGRGANRAGAFFLYPLPGAKHPGVGRRCPALSTPVQVRLQTNPETMCAGESDRAST
jgi:hypothetical protein